MSNDNPSSINSETLPGEPEVIGGEGYQDQSEFPPPPPEGVYTFTQGQADFEERDRILHVIFGDPRNGKRGHTITGGPQDGKQITFDRLSTTVFDRNGVRAATIVDHLRAVGLKGAYNLNDHDTLRASIEATESKPFKAQLGWEGICADCLSDISERYAKGTKEYKKAIKLATLKGERRWPELPDKTRAAVVECRDHGTEIRARARIVRRIPA